MEKLEEILTRFGDKVANSGDQNSAGQGGPHYCQTRDFFIADIATWALKDDRHSMEHPIFGLSKTSDREIRRYEHNGVKNYGDSDCARSRDHLGQGRADICGQPINRGHQPRPANQQEGTPKGV